MAQALAAASAAAPAAAVPMPYVFGSVNQRNKELNSLAAADAFHDFNTAGRINSDNQELLNKYTGGRKVMDAIWSETRAIGTFEEPVGAIQSEDAMLGRILGMRPEDIKARLRRDGAVGVARIVDIDGKPIEYEWNSVVVGEKEGDTFEYKKSSKSLYEAIVGSAAETSLYFMIDAINVNFYDALIRDVGAMEKKAFYVNSRERMNDAAGDRDISKYAAASAGKKVRLELIEDEYEHRTTYPAMTAESKAPASLFNSVFTLTLEGKMKSKTKEGLDSTTLSFKNHNGGVLRNVVIKAGTLEGENSVNSLYKRLVNFFKVKGWTKTAADLEDYYIALQQKRSGDWLQVLSTFDTKRFQAIPVGEPVYLATLDRLCVVYGLCVGANIIYTYHEGNKYMITIFRRKTGKVDPKARLREEVISITRHENVSIYDAPIDGAETISYKDAVASYTHFIAQKVTDLERAIQVPALGAGGRFSPSGFDVEFIKLMKAVYDLILVLYTFPFRLSFLVDVNLTPKQVKSKSIKETKLKFRIYQENVNALRDLLRQSPAAFGSVEIFGNALEATWEVFQKSNPPVERYADLSEFRMAEPVYNQKALGLFSRIEPYIIESVAAKIKAYLNHVEAKSNEAMGSVPKVARIIRMNAILIRYLLCRDVTNFPADAIPSFSAILEKTFAKPAPERKVSPFAVHRILARAYQNFVEGGQRVELIRNFQAEFQAGAAGATFGGGHTKRKTIMKTKTAKRKPLVFMKPQIKATLAAIKEFAENSLGSAVYGSLGSLERKYRRKQADIGVMSSVVPLYLVALYLEEILLAEPTIHTEIAKSIYRFLNTALRKDTIAAYRENSGIISPAAFQFYWELLADVIFRILPNAPYMGGDALQILQDVFPFQPLALGEFGGMLSKSILGDRAGFEFSTRDTELDKWMFVFAFTRLLPIRAFSERGVGAAIDRRGLSTTLKGVLRTYEGYEMRTGSTPPRTPPHTMKKRPRITFATTRRRSKSKSGVASMLIDAY